jgi:hypothetical protein
MHGKNSKCEEERTHLWCNLLQVGHNTRTLLLKYNLEFVDHQALYIVLRALKGNESFIIIIFIQRISSKW